MGDCKETHWASQAANDNFDQPPTGVAGLEGLAGLAGLAGRAGRAPRDARAGLAGRAVPPMASEGHHATTRPDSSRHTRPGTGPSQFPLSTDHACPSDKYAIQFISESKRLSGGSIQPTSSQSLSKSGLIGCPRLSDCIDDVLS